MNKPFARRDAMVAHIEGRTSGIEFLGPVAVQMLMMQLAVELGSYRSRGKGRGTQAHVYGNPAGKYKPHQGKRECARRAARMG